ncbi:rap guanine nucleotide exchange factor 1-like isoform X5 [Brachionus plicatilis]|uniref:Rap guanine nucleotide exchange factor 1-like isoform X5 n=1 Tax=Brachionus plicatilis TaxID=10195 RepID=A0A3M7RAX5_BRAPC|nr:rap guanine nucleotide exchange factor 1-like isoform X5 [Brachionus plicatilis]
MSKNHSARNLASDGMSEKAKANRFNRTYTLPRRFKEKFLTTNSLSLKAASKASADSSPVNTCLLTKSVDSLLKSIKYLEQILLKKKYELISSISTAILECVLEIYNLIKLMENNGESTRLKLQLNTSLANFIKWSDSVLCSTGRKEHDGEPEFAELTSRWGPLTQQLLDAVQNLVDYVRHTGKHAAQKECGAHKTRSASSSSTSTKIEHAGPRVTTHTGQDNTITKTIETQLHDNVVQISTLTRMTNDATKDIIDHGFDNFFNLDKIALELSQISSIDSNAKCNYLLRQFESFAKEFNLSEKCSTSCHSTLNRSKNSSNYSSPSRSVSGSVTQKKILYKNSKFVHESESKVKLEKKVHGCDQCVQDSTTSASTTHKTNFVQTNYLSDKELGKILLDDKLEDQTDAECTRGRTPDREANVSAPLMDQVAPKLPNDLNPEFLLIDDDDDEEEEEEKENLSEDALVVVDSKNVASFSSGSVSNSSLSILPKMTPNDALNVHIALNESNLSISQSPVQSAKTDNLQSESSLSGSSNVSNNWQWGPGAQSILTLLDVGHLLEYQSSSTISSPHAVSLPNSAVLRGGEIDALIVLATSANSSVIAPPNNHSGHSLTTGSMGKDKAGANFLFQEAFLTTYRTILEPMDLIKKLIFRYRSFTKKNDLNNNMDRGEHSLERTKANRRSYEIEYNDKFDLNRLKSNIRLNKMTSSAIRNSLTLMVRVLDGLRTELDDTELIEILNNFIFELVIDDELQMARLLRKKLLHKLEKRRLEKLDDENSLIEDKIDQFGKLNSSRPQIIPYSFAKKSQSILDFKSMEIAEQMTLIDLKLFNKIELSEVLLWSTKQSEKLSPNLIKFTEHFNNISYWARSRILESENYRDRERYLIKFLKIMKYLRKMNNFNSYLSILSAVDSGPIQRLDWPKSIIDTIKEYAALIDPKCGFKSLREAISEAEPPCIPHIGLILQDLTILHIANPDFLPSGNCNFWKRWQQFNILERLRYFKRCNYNFRPNVKIHELFNDFKDYIGEDAQYNLSEQLKPRTKH